MGKRRLLLLTYHFPPSAASAVFRLLGFVRYLPEHNWDVTVIAPPEMPGEPRDAGLLKEVPACIKVRAVPIPMGITSRVARRYFGDSVWLPRAWSECKRVVAEWRPDCVLTSSPPAAIHALGHLVSRRFGIPWLADFRDPWIAGYATDAAQSIRGRWAVRAEWSIMRNAQRVIANTPRMCDVFRQAFPEHSAKFTVISNGFDPERFQQADATTRVTPPFGLTAPATQSAVTTLVHAGELYHGRNPRPLFESLARLERTRRMDQPAWRFRLLGQSIENRGDLLAAVRAYDLEHVVQFEGQVPYGDALRAMGTADILVLLDTPGRRWGVPAKIFEYLGARRPILALADPAGELPWVLGTNGPHRVVDCHDVAGIERALTELSANLHLGHLTALDEQHVRQFTRAELAAKLAGELERSLEATAS